MGNKDYTDWNGRKRKLQRQHEENKAKQKEEQPKKSKKNRKGDSVTHRLNRAETLVCDLCRCLAYFVQKEEEAIAEKEKKDPQQKPFNMVWWTKFRISDAEGLLKRADELLEKGESSS